MLEYKKQFKKLAPQWYEELKTPLKECQKVRNPKLNIGDLKYSIVGEIYGFSNYYGYNDDDNYCLYCHFLSVKMSDELILKRDNSLISELIDHINKDHPELIQM